MVHYGGVACRADVRPRRAGRCNLDIEFQGGPYDGLWLSDAEVRRCSLPLRVRTAGGIRLFSLLPQPADWDAVFEGGAEPADTGLYPYELVLTPGRGCGAEFVDAAENGEFGRAMAEGWSE